MEGIDELISRQFSGEASPAEQARLAAWIQSDPARAREYAIQTLVHHRIGERMRSVAQLTSITPQAPARRFIGRREVALALAACLLLGVALPLFFTRTSANTVVVAEQLQAVWKSDVSAGLRGPTELRSGSARLDFPSGATVWIESQARFSTDGNVLDLVEGKLIARCPTERARELVVRAAGREVVDLGTEFGVRLDPAGMGSVCVFQGQIRCSDLTGKAAMTMQAGQSASLNSMRLDAVPDLSAWADLARFDLRLAAAKQSDAWPLKKLALLDDPALVFSLDQRGGRAIDLRSTLPLPSTSGGVATARGRFDRAGAFEFSAPGDALQGRLTQSFDTLTFAAWVWLESEPTDPPRHRGLVMSAGWRKPGQMHWQAKGRDFRLSYFDRGDEIDPRFAASPDGLIDGRWHLYTTVVRRLPHMEVSHFLDGRLVYRRALDAVPPSLTLGDFSLGGWTSHDPEQSDRTLNGKIDDLLIWSRALTDKQVLDLYESSRP